MLESMVQALLSRWCSILYVVVWLVVPTPMPAVAAARLSVSPCSVVAFGDSITWGAYASQNVVSAYLPVTPVEAHVVGPRDTTYPGDLARLLHTSVCNFGIPGELIEQGRWRFSALLHAYRARLIILLEGVNDLHSERTDTGILADLAAMRVVARDRKVPVLVSTLTPTYYSPHDPRFYLNAAVARLSAGIRAWSQREDQPLVDVNRAFARDPRGWRLTADALHPNDMGYRLMAETIARTVRRTRFPH